MDWILMCVKNLGDLRSLPPFLDHSVIITYLLVNIDSHLLLLVAVVSLYRFYLFIYDFIQ